MAREGATQVSEEGHEARQAMGQGAEFFEIILFLKIIADLNVIFYKIVKLASCQLSISRQGTYRPVSDPHTTSQVKKIEVWSSR